MVENRKQQWDESYNHRDNFLFHPHDEVIRFVSRFIRKRVGLDEFQDVSAELAGGRILDLGCGIGRHVIYCHEMGLDAWGIDLSDSAVRVARQWAERRGVPELDQRIRQGDITSLPYEDGFFTCAVSHGVLDSMPFGTARAGCCELARVIQPGGLFYCDLASGDDSRHAREFSGEEVVSTAHEFGTVQLYYNMRLILALVEDLFVIEGCQLVRHENVFKGGHHSRYHVVFRKLPV